MKKEIRKKDIAIVGFAGRFHDSKNVREFWNNLAEGKELLKRFNEEELLQRGVDASTLNNPDFVPVESIVEKAESFDYSFFGYTKDEANAMDPQIRMMHELVWTALEDAGYNPDTFTGKVGAFLSASEHTNWLAHTATVNSENVNPFFLSQLRNKDFISSLISYSLNLKGPSYHTATACSSSLVSTHIACRSLLLRECSVALAGGVSLMTQPSTGYLYQEGMIVAKDGHCRAFDAEASGCIKGNGGGVVVLKRMEDAIRDKDHIYAIIRGTATNNDGKEKAGYTAPSVDGQANCIKLAQNFGGVPYESISYIETHGTATRLGDPIEISALNKAFNNDTNHTCAIGSLKSNMGHLDVAAGVAGLIKASLALKNKKIPASLNYTSPNPLIDFSAGPFSVNTELTNWERINEEPLRAGVSSFGIGGTNAHAVIEEFLPEKTAISKKEFQIFPIAAKSESALENYQRELTEFIQKTEENIADVAYTQSVGRKGFANRTFLIANTTDSTLVEALQEIKVAKEDASTVFMFPGQGNQYYGMLKDVYEKEPFIKEIIDYGLDTLQQLTGENYREIIGYKEGADRELINNTKYTQPILFLVEYALAKYLMHLGVQPSQMIGHSLGEYVAACIAGVFSFEDGLKILVKRALLMSQLEEGTMLAIGVSVEEIQSLLTRGIDVAAVNTSNTCIVSGDNDHINIFKEILEDREIPFSELKTSHAFHSYMMDDMLEEFEAELKAISLQVPTISFISNLTGKEITTEEATATNYWVQHLRETVRFAEGLNAIKIPETSIFVEVGPGKSMRSFCKQNQRTRNSETVGTMRHIKETQSDTLELTKALGNLWCNGIQIDWERYYEHETRCKVSIPTYQFDYYAFDFTVDPFSDIFSKKFSEKTVYPYKDWFYHKSWKKSVLTTENQFDAKDGILLFTEKNALSNVLKKNFITEKQHVYEVYKGKRFENFDELQFGILPNEETEYTQLFNTLAAQNITCGHIVYNWNFKGKSQEAITNGFKPLLHVCKALINYQPEVRKKLTIVTDFGNNVIGTEQQNIIATTVSTIGSVLAQENANIVTQTIDVDIDKTCPELLKSICDELNYNKIQSNVAYRNGQRWVDFYENLPIVEKPTTNIKAENVYLITGGLGFLGRTLAAHLTQKFDAKVVLTGRQELPEKAQWDSYELNDDSAVAKKVRILQELTKEGKQVHYYAVDLTNEEALAETIAKIETNVGAISGIIHAAGNIDNQTFKFIENIDDESIQAQFNPKIQATQNIANVFENKPLDFVWLASSLASILGGLSYGAYATANRFMDAFVQDRTNWIAVNLDGLGKGAMETYQIVDVFEQTVHYKSLRQCVVSMKNPNAILEAQFKSKAIEETIERNVKTAAKKANYVAPQTETETSLAKIWEDFFGYDHISITENFFELGGDSLKAMTLIKRIHKHYNVEISLLDFFSKPTIQELSAEIDITLQISKPTIENEKRTNVIKI
ncbi:type I polyketide synthase [Kordia zhangzhouensis]|uniref:type I polyketide synthase n=1 Tax=Kordia zhangzhouensis TaxID=1620405 RepID=UPI000629034B|nr:type I polyketide synthase [Kordia zhangzhouensis]